MSAWQRTKQPICGRRASGLTPFARSLPRLPAHYLLRWAPPSPFAPSACVQACYRTQRRIAP